MKTLEIAQKLANLKSVSDAQKAYALALTENNHQDPLVDLEAAAYILLTGGDAKLAFTQLAYLYNNGNFQEEIMGLLMKQLYLPSVAKRQKKYELNLKKLSQYPYLFYKNFIDFVDLKIKFFPFGEGFLPFYSEENRFGEYIDFNRKVIDRYFFKDLEKPIFEKDVYSQYQLEYLYDNVRKSEWVAYDNHIYLHYTDWQEFCAYLQVIDFNKLLKEEKFIFLMEGEEKRYPLDFAGEFGIDYHSYTIKPIGVGEVNKLIWHAQLSAHNGGDFFNEVFDFHPNLLAMPSMMLYNIEKTIADVRTGLKQNKILDFDFDIGEVKFPIRLDFRSIKNPTDKDILVKVLLAASRERKSMKENCRIAPAVFLQPHFHNVYYNFTVDEKSNRVKLHSEEFQILKNHSMFKGFKYIKTFVPMRRPTTSYAATMRYRMDLVKDKNSKVLDNQLAKTLLNCSYRIDPFESLYRDSCLVRFEDAKLNPKATFNALARFLDIPYTESMTYCSLYGEKDPESMGNNVIGFNTSSVYKTYDEFAGRNERYVIEFLMREAYEKYGYDFLYYDGKEPDNEKLMRIVEDMDVFYRLIAESYKRAVETWAKHEEISTESANITYDIGPTLEKTKEANKRIASILSHDLTFVNNEEQPLQLLALLEPDEDFLEKPLYR